MVNAIFILTFFYVKKQCNILEQRSEKKMRYRKSRAYKGNCYKKNMN